MIFSLCKKAWTYYKNSLDGSLLKFGYVEKNMPLLIKPTALQLYSNKIDDIEKKHSGFEPR